MRYENENFRLALQNRGFVPARFDRALRYLWIYNPHPDFEPGEVIGKRDDELEDTEGARRLVALKRRVIETGKGAREEIDFERSDGTRTYDFAIEPLFDAGGAIVGGTSTAFDVTARRRADRELSRANLLLESMAAITRVSMACLDTELVLLWVNPAFAAAVGREPADLAGTNLAELIPHQEKLAAFRRVVETGEAIEVRAAPFELPGRPGPDTTFWDWRLDPVKDADGKVAGLLLAMTDVTDTVRRNQDLERLALDLCSDNERERRQVAHTLQEDLQQIMALAKLLAGSIQAAVSSDQKLSRSVQKLVDTLAHGIQTARALCHDLDPPLLDAEGLGPALGRLAASVRSRHGLDVETDIQDDGHGLSGNRLAFAYRAAKELLANTIAHAGVDQARLGLRREAGSLRIAVEDHGAGFDPAALRQAAAEDRRRGLYGIERQARLLGGALEIESSPGAGSRFVLRLPLDETG